MSVRLCQIKSVYVGGMGRGARQQDKEKAAELSAAHDLVQIMPTTAIESNPIIQTEFRFEVNIAIIFYDLIISILQI